MEDESCSGGRRTPTPALGLFQEARRLGPLRSSLLRPESLPPAREEKMRGCSALCFSGFSDGSQRLPRLELAVGPLPDPLRISLGKKRWACPTGAEASQHFRGTGSSCSVASTRASKAEPSHSPEIEQQQLVGKGEWLRNLRCQDDPQAIKRKRNSIWDARPRAPQRPALWFSGSWQQPPQGIHS